MKKLLILFAIFIGLVSANAQNNPFAELGYEPKIATLSNGQFNESFDNDTIVQIGSIMFNTKSKQIVAFVEIDTMYSEATLEPDIVSRWISPDPLADHPMQIGKSPYQYAWNNPVYWTDPDGQCPFCPWLDAVVDVGFIIYDVSLLGYDYATTGTTKGEDWAALSADVLSIAVPMTVGAGLAARATYKAAKTVDKVKVVTKPYSKSRPSYAKKQVDEVWNKAKQTDGNVYDPNTGELLKWDKSKPRNGQWDMGHKSGQEYKKLKKSYDDGTIPKDEFLKQYKDVNKYQPESTGSNRSRKFENK